MKDIINKKLEEFDEKFPKLYKKCEDSLDTRIEVILERKEGEVKSFLKSSLEEVVKDTLKKVNKLASKE